EVDVDRKTVLPLLEKYAFIRKQIECPEIHLEPLRPDHAAALCANATPEILRLTRLPVVLGQEQAVDWIYSQIADLTQYGFAITHRESGFIGVISVSVAGGAGWFFYWLGETYWGRGYATVALCKLFQFVFDGLDLEELFTCVKPYNERSAHILSKLGAS